MIPGGELRSHMPHDGQISKQTNRLKEREKLKIWTIRFIRSQWGFFSLVGLTFEFCVDFKVFWRQSS